MLKPYFERKNGVQVVNTIEVGSDNNMEDTTELFNLSESTKLHNSDVLRDLNTKLRHLNESQREDIKALIQEYQSLFPDVRSRTDRIAHDVEINDAPPQKQKLSTSWKTILLNQVKVVGVHLVCLFLNLTVVIKCALIIEN